MTFFKTALCVILSIVTLLPSTAHAQGSAASASKQYLDPYAVVQDMLHWIGNDIQAINAYDQNKEGIQHLKDEWERLKPIRPIQAQRMQPEYDLCVRAYADVTAIAEPFASSAPTSQGHADSATPPDRNAARDHTDIVIPSIIAARDLLAQAQSMFSEIPQSDLFVASNNNFALLPRFDTQQYMSPEYTPSSLTPQTPIRAGQTVDLALNGQPIDWSQFDNAMREQLEQINTAMMKYNATARRSSATFQYTVARDSSGYWITVNRYPAQSSGDAKYDALVRSFIQQISPLPLFPAVSTAAAVTKDATIGAGEDKSGRTASDIYTYSPRHR